MTRRLAILVGVPVLAAVLLAIPLGLWRGPYQWLCAGIALTLTVLPASVTLILAERLAKKSATGALVALVLGTALRMGVGFGGGVVVFLAARSTFQPDPISYFSWLLGLYLTTLAVEMTLLGRNPGGVGERHGVNPSP